MADKKIAIMTWLYNGNYGTLLQAYALHTFVKNEGYEVENINYISSLKTKLKNWLVNRNSPALVVYRIKEKFFKKEGLFVWISIATVISNILICKSIDILGFTTALGNILFASTFLATDILVEKYGVKDSRKAIVLGVCSPSAL